MKFKKKKKLKKKGGGTDIFIYMNTEKKSICWADHKMGSREEHGKEKEKDWLNSQNKLCLKNSTRIIIIFLLSNSTRITNIDKIR